jgi:ATP-dependent DNA ligase
MENAFNMWTSEGYEGLIIRNNKVEYRYNERSSDVFKYKKPLDGEYRIIGYKVDKLGHPVLLCEIEPGGVTFSVKPTGTDEYRRDILNNIEYYIDKWYKIEYEELSKSNIPLKPVGICLRNCDDLGNPLE